MDSIRFSGSVGFIIYKRIFFTLRTFRLGYKPTNSIHIEHTHTYMHKHTQASFESWSALLIIRFVFILALGRYTFAFSHTHIYTAPNTQTYRSSREISKTVNQFFFYSQPDASFRLFAVAAFSSSTSCFGLFFFLSLLFTVHKIVWLLGVIFFRSVFVHRVAERRIERSTRKTEEDEKKNAHRETTLNPLCDRRQKTCTYGMTVITRCTCVFTDDVFGSHADLFSSLLTVCVCASAFVVCWIKATCRTQKRADCIAVAVSAVAAAVSRYISTRISCSSFDFIMRVKNNQAKITRI